LQEVLQGLLGVAEGGEVFFGGQAVVAAMPTTAGGHDGDEAMPHAIGLGFRLHVGVPNAGVADQADGMPATHGAL
jgi:hypothetical protein